MTPYDDRVGEVVVALAVSDGPSLTVFKRRLNGILFAGHRAIVVDLTSTSAMDNETLAGLCATLRHAGAGGASLRIVGADDRTREVLQLCEVDGLKFYRSVKRALKGRRADSTRRERLGWRAAPERWAGLRRSPSRPVP